MKNAHNNHIKQARIAENQKAQSIDVVYIASIDEQAIVEIAQQNKKKRRIDYNKKIMNDPFIMSV